ncbi:MAG: RluA family pseudouridine synthase [Planctomycetota bacterium]
MAPRTTYPMPDPRPAPPLLCVLRLETSFAVVLKPPGLHAVPGRTPEKFDSIQARARLAFEWAQGPITVHRLDRDTSGLMVVGLTQDSHRSLSIQFQDRKVDKRYTALLEGSPPASEGLVNLPLCVDWPNRPRHMVDFEHGKPATTRYRVVKETGDRTLVEFEPVTGRTHQLRVHAATPVRDGGLGAPIVGDTLYGSMQDDEIRSPPGRMMLHASGLTFSHPQTGETLAFTDTPDFHGPFARRPYTPHGEHP